MATIISLQCNSLSQIHLSVYVRTSAEISMIDEHIAIG